MLNLTSIQQYFNINETLRKKINEYLSFALHNVPFYQTKFANKQVSIENFYNLPLTQGIDLTENPMSLVALKDKIVLMTSSSGTYGKQKIIFRTNDDLQKIAETTYKVAECCGITSKDKIVMIQPFELANLGHGSLRTFQKIGALSCPLGLTTSPEYILWLLKEMKFNVVFSTPSKAVYLAELSKKKEVASEIRITKVVCAGEPIFPIHREKIRELWGADILGTYGSEEIDGISSECSNHNGYHVMDDNLIIEVLDEKTMQPAETNRGVLVVTKMNYTGTVLLRYLIGDLIEIDESNCQCGRDAARIKILGRMKETSSLNDGLKSPFPVNIPLASFDFAIKFVVGYIPIYQLIIEQIDNKDTITININYDPSESLANEVLRKILSSNKDLERCYIDHKINVKIQLFSDLTDFYSTRRGKIPKIYDKRNHA